MWKCVCCGNCCELFSSIVFGNICKWFNPETRRCDNYENRPQICRTDLARLLHKNNILYNNINIEEYLIVRCLLLKHLKNWKKETEQYPQAQKFLLEAIAKAKL